MFSGWAQVRCVFYTWLSVFFLVFVYPPIRVSSHTQRAHIVFGRWDKKEVFMIVSVCVCMCLNEL